MKEFKITRENVIDVLEVLVNRVDCFTDIRREDGTYIVKYYYTLPDPSNYAQNIEYRPEGRGEEISDAVQSIVDQMQQTLDTRIKMGGENRLKDWQIDLEMNLSSALGLLRHVSREEFQKRHPNFPGVKTNA
jgi:hypothetical protein